MNLDQRYVQVGSHAAGIGLYDKLLNFNAGGRARRCELEFIMNPDLLAHGGPSQFSPPVWSAAAQKSQRYRQKDRFL